jgi:hypothetical protein
MATTTTTTTMTMTNVDDKALGASTTRPRAQAHGIFISRRANATTTTTIGDDEQQVSDDEASCASAQHNAIVRKCTCYASNIDATTSQATSNLDGHELNHQT